MSSPSRILYVALLLLFHLLLSHFANIENSVKEKEKNDGHKKINWLAKFWTKKRTASLFAYFGLLKDGYSYGRLVENRMEKYANKHKHKI